MEKGSQQRFKSFKINKQHKEVESHESIKINKYVDIRNSEEGSIKYILV